MDTCLPFILFLIINLFLSLVALGLRCSAGCLSGQRAGAAPGCSAPACRRSGFSPCRTQARGSQAAGAAVLGLSSGHSGLVSPWPVESPQTHVPCVGRLMLIHFKRGRSILYGTDRLIDELTIAVNFPQHL